METSILKSTKKVLNVPEEYTAFDLDIITAIDSSFSTLVQLGVGPDEGFSIEDSTTTWDDLGLSKKLTNMVKTYINLKALLVFDPPTTSFLLDARKEQIAELEWRISAFREELIPIPERPNTSSEEGPVW